MSQGAPEVTQAQKEQLADSYIVELRSQLKVVKNSVEEELLSTEHIDRIRKKILGEKMGIFKLGVGKWLEGNFSMWKLDRFSIKEFTIAGKKYDSIFDFMKEIHEKIEMANTQDELNLLMQEIQQNVDLDADTDTNNDNVDQNLDNLTPAQKAIATAVELATDPDNSVTGDHCWDRVVEKIYASAGFELGKNISVLYQSGPYGNKVDAEVGDENLDYSQEANYLTLLDGLEIGDHIIFHNGNVPDTNGDHSAIFMGWSAQGKPVAKLASLHNSGGVPDITKYDLGLGDPTSYGTPMGMVRSIRRPVGVPLSNDKIANNLSQMRLANVA